MKGVANLIARAGKRLEEGRFFNQEKTDHKSLVRHIMALNQKESALEIVLECADCLMEMTRYRVFSFAIKTPEGTQIWMDPETGCQKLNRTIEKEFFVPDGEKIPIQGLGHRASKTGRDLHLEHLVSYTVAARSYYARIYLIPGRRMKPHHDAIAQMLLKSAAGALFTRLKLARLSNAATMDPLTGCYNRREFERQLTHHTSHSNRYGTDLSLLMFDLDHFKRVNDRHGHPAGDQVLKHVAGLVKENIRKADTLYRYGGEEFIALLPGADGFKAAEMAARLCRQISKTSVHHMGKTLKVTASFGVACFSANEMTEAEFVKKADEMLYRAKMNGRNQVMPGMLKMVPDRTVLSGTGLHVV